MINLPKGTIVRVSCRRNLPGVFTGDWSRVLLDSGPLFCMRQEIHVLRDQESAKPPMRPRLPYGIWTCADGREVLFNRDYRPIWQRTNKGATTEISSTEWVHWEKQEWFFDDRNTPWQDKRTIAFCEAILNAWGVPEPSLSPRRQWLEFLNDVETYGFPPTVRRIPAGETGELKHPQA